MLVLWGFAIHIVFLASIFDIYFKSPVITGVAQYKPSQEAPATRLVLFVADGLRMESLRKSREASYLKSIMKKRGSWGISNTRIPTESRPGHVAIIAGFYEDPSAIARGWKENPVDFDSVFNQSRHTWSWGSPDILPMFAKGATGNHVETHYYSHEEEDFSGKVSTTKLDTWVFDNVERFFANAENDDALVEKLKQDKIVLFLHLLGLDTAGHTHKPHSKEYQNNIRVVDEGVAKIEALIENYFGNDSKTAYIFTADHGMTDWGSHGAGGDHETQTPLIAWGAGIAGPDPRYEAEHKTKMKDVNQADICPLMAALIGVPTPVNSVGTLPEPYLGTAPDVKAWALYSNARQILNQYDRKREVTEAKAISALFKPFANLTKSKMQKSIQQLEVLLSDEHYDKAMALSKQLISLGLTGLDYYQNYYQNILLNCMTFSFLGWIWLLFTVLLQGVKTNQNLEKSPFKTPRSKACYLDALTDQLPLKILFGSCILVIVYLIYVQELPAQYYIYCTLPVLIWWNAALSWRLWLRYMITLKDNTSAVFRVLKLSFTIAIYLIGILILVVSFFHRWALSVAMFGLALFPFKESHRKTLSWSFLLSWVTSCISLAGFSFLPVIGKQDDKHLVAMSGVSWFVCSMIFMSSYSLPMMKCGKETKKENIAMLVPAVMMLLAIQNKYFVHYSFNEKGGLPLICQILTWVLTALSMIVPLLSSRWVISRLFSIYSSLAVFFILLSVSHEGFFLLILTINLFCWLTIEHQSSRIHQSIKLSHWNFMHQNKATSFIKISPIDRSLNSDDFRRAYIFLLYIIFSFFGTGNIASINSFDPQWVRSYVAQFSPFLMGGLILCKTLIPFLCVACTFCAVNMVVKAPTGHLFLIVLIFCDLMGLHFLHLVTNKGSWLDIGTSISHYVIMETTVLFVSLLYGLGQILTGTSLWALGKNQPEKRKD